MTTAFALWSRSPAFAIYGPSGILLFPIKWTHWSHVMFFVRLVAVFVLMLFNGSATAAERLAIGDQAPAIDIEHWISEKPPITDFEPGKVYVIEFWATWCGPCVTSIPHLRDLQVRHGDAITVISVSDEPLVTIEQFLKREHEGQSFAKITSAYWLASDPDGSVKEGYMRAAGLNGIPTAFVVGKTSQIEWIGHPMRIDEPVEKILAGTWDRAAYQREMAERTAFIEKLRHAAQLALKQDFDGAESAIGAIVSSAPTDELRQIAEAQQRNIQAQSAKWAAGDGRGQGAFDINQLAIGDQVTIRVTGRAEGRVWGDAIYSAESDIGAAAVHAGLMQPGESRWLKMWVVPSPSRFPESFANGVQTRARGRATAAFFLQPAEATPVAVLLGRMNQGVVKPAPRRVHAKIEGHPEQHDASRRWYENELKEIGANPGPVAPSGKDVGKEDEIAVGQVLLVQYGTSWWGARVVHLFPDGRVWIRYLGWSPVFDEAVNRNRLQFDDEALMKARQTVAARVQRALP